MTKHDHKCRSCRLYDLLAVLNKVGAVMPNSAARCLWEWPELDLPTSIPRHERKCLPSATYMEPNMGENCPCWEKRQ